MLDFEGFACTKGRSWDATDSVGWKQFADGWAQGIREVEAVNLWLTTAPAIYVNQTEYVGKHASDIGLPIFLAINPIPAKKPLTGSNIVGYAAFYASCSTPTASVRKVSSWGVPFSTVQFDNSAVCPRQ